MDSFKPAEIRERIVEASLNIVTKQIGKDARAK
jgi:hypothetical protein